jgi:hypothetical protein
MTHTFIKTLVISAAITAVPALSQAASQPQAMRSCVAAFMQALSRHNTPLKLSQSRYLDNGLSPVGSNTLVLIANDAHDNHVVGQAICRLDAQGQVIGLEEVSPYALSL